MTVADVDLQDRPPAIGFIEQRMARPPLARDVVRYAGDIVAVVLTETREEGIDAAEHVHVDYDPLPPVVDPEDSLRGEVLLFPDVGTNVCAHVPPAGDDGIFEGCEVVVSRPCGQPADGSGAARAALDRGLVRGRPPARLALHPDAAQRP